VVVVFHFCQRGAALATPPEGILSVLVRPGETAVEAGFGMGYLTITMARLVGETCMVIAVDLRERMLAGARHRAHRAGLASRIRVQWCRPDALGLDGRVDFVLAFYMVHEVTERRRLRRELRRLCGLGGRMRPVEPVLHVRAADLKASAELAQEGGFALLEARLIRLSRAALLGTASPQGE